ncbi:hypothetical protein [Planktotalea arctica]|uniref:hypothetical protein n=1 Tax=Planktotalea arctica TaxID=1481893 RepID=UPI00321AB722
MTTTMATMIATVPTSAIIAICAVMSALGTVVAMCAVTAMGARRLMRFGASGLVALDRRANDEQGCDACQRGGDRFVAAALASLRLHI